MFCILHTMQNMHNMQNVQPTPGTFLTTKDVQTLVNVDRSTIYRMAETGRIPAVKVGRQWRFPADRIHAWLEAGTSSEAAVRPRSAHRETTASGPLQTVAELMGSVFGAMVIVTDMEGEPLTEVANPCGMFQAVAAHPETLRHCVEGWREFGDDPDLVPRFTPSHLGFLCARGFVRKGSELTGMVIVGGIAPETWPPDDSQLAAVASEVGLPAHELIEHAPDVYHLDAAARQRILDLLPKFGVLISQISIDRAAERPGHVHQRSDA